MKVETHAHTSGISLCSEVDYKTTAELYIAQGYGALLLSNHYNAYQLASYGVRAPRFAEMFVDEYRNMRDYAAGRLNVLLGAEVALDLPDCRYAEFLLVGADEQFFLNHSDLFRLNQRQLYALCKENGVLLVQTHPYRKEQGHFPHDAAFMDGVEINCHPHFLREEEKVRRFAEKHGLLVTCGSDFHYAPQAGSAGMLTQRDVRTSREFSDCLREGKAEIFFR